MKNWVRFICKFNGSLKPFKAEVLPILDSLNLVHKQYGFTDEDDGNPATADNSYVSFPINALTQTEMQALEQALKDHFGYCHISFAE